MVASAWGTAVAVVLGGIVVLGVGIGALAWVRRTPSLGLPLEPVRITPVE